MSHEQYAATSKKKQNSLSPNPIAPESPEKMKTVCPQPESQASSRGSSRNRVMTAGLFGLCMVLICAGFFWLGTRMDDGKTIQGQPASTETNVETAAPTMTTTVPTESPESEYVVIAEEEDGKEAWSEWVVYLPDGITDSDYEIESKTQYSYYKYSQLNWEHKGSWWCRECDVNPGLDRYVQESVEDIWENCWRTENGECVCGGAHVGGYSPPDLIVGGSTVTSQEMLVRTATQYRYLDDGKISWSPWQFEAVSASELRQVETRTVYQYGTRETKSTHYHCHPYWSAFSDEVVEADDDTVVRTRVVYRYRKLA